MTDITSTLDVLLQKHHACIRNKHRRFQADVVDGFLKEAYRINSHIAALNSYLYSIRQCYLSTSLPFHRSRDTAPSRHIHHSTSAKVLGPQNRTYFTDGQRDQIDTEAKAMLRDLNAGIWQLEEVERLRRQTELRLAEKKHGVGIGTGLRTLHKWAAGNVGVSSSDVGKNTEEKVALIRREMLDGHRNSIIWYLRRRLEEATMVQREMMERRIEREVEKSKSVLYKTRETRGEFAGDQGRTYLSGSSHLEAASNAGNGFDGSLMDGEGNANGYAGRSPVMDEKERLQIEQALSPEQLQLFAQENNELLKRYEDTLDQVRTAERSMLEIAELQTTLAMNLELQATCIDQLAEDAVNTEGNVVGGNRELKRATERWRPAKVVFWASCGLCAGLVAWDLVV